MDLSFLGNLAGGIPNWILGTLGGFAVPMIGWWIYGKLEINKMIKGGLKIIGNRAGLKAKEVILDRIKDKKIYKETEEILITAPNEYDAGWDMGIRGIKL